jgi:hypothetical protein
MLLPPALLLLPPLLLLLQLQLAAADRGVVAPIAVGNATQLVVDDALIATMSSDLVRSFHPPSFDTGVYCVYVCSTHYSLSQFIPSYRPD